MKRIRFEYKIALLYLLIGGIWILFSDRFLIYFTKDFEVLIKVQTYKGWFYVFITAIFLFFFSKIHLSRLRQAKKELSEHKSNLEQMVVEKTQKLDSTNQKLNTINKTLNEKNKIINEQNTELKKILKNLHQTQTKLHQADKMATIGILTAGIAHEINNPLNYIQGGLTGLEDYFGDKNIQDKKITLFLESIKAGVDRAGNIVSGLNQLSRSKNTYDEDCDINEIIGNCLILTHNHLKDRVEIVRKFEEPEPHVKGNVGQLHQVFINLLINASQAIEGKGTITIETKIEKAKVLVKVTDNGGGIEKENLTKIVDPFFTTKEPGKGTGLGLSISNNIIEQHKGDIKFQSKLKKGTAVTVTLPLKT